MKGTTRNKNRGTDAGVVAPVVDPAGATTTDNVTRQPMEVNNAGPA